MLQVVYNRLMFTDALRFEISLTLRLNDASTEKNKLRTFVEETG